jgi:hypothetical protein
MHAYLYQLAEEEGLNISDLEELKSCFRLIIAPLRICNNFSGDKLKKIDFSTQSIDPAHLYLFSIQTKQSVIP